MIRLLYLWVVIALMGMPAGLAAGDIYQWVDENGVRHFTDGPPPPGAQVVEGLTQNDPSAPPANPVSTDDEKARRDEDQAAGASEVEEAAAADDDGDVSGGREDYWRRRGWGTEATDGQSPETVDSGEGDADGRPNPGADERDGKRSVD